MEIYYNLQDFRKSPNTVVTLGNFDGVHLGHRTLIGNTVAMAREVNGTPALFTFDPHPMKVLQPEASPAQLLSREDKIRILRELGIEVVIIAPFSKEMSKMSPETFIYEVLHGTFAARGIVVGYNYTFGHRGRGGPELLQQFAPQFDYRLTVIPPVFACGYEVSSTVIRQFLLAGEVERAGQLLGYHPFIRGRVSAGDRRGREMGFPTANLDLPDDILVPANGVYAVRVFINGDVHCGVANIGIKPTFFNNQPKNLEVHIFDFARDIYDAAMKVEFLSRIREEKSFRDAAELTEQIRSDCALARDITRCLGGHKPLPD